MSLGEAVRFYEENDPRGEYVLVVAGADPAEKESRARAAFEDISVEEHVRQYMEQGLSQKEAMRRAAADRGLSRRDIYQQMKVK